MATCRFPKRPESIPAVEDYLRGLPFLSKEEKDRAVILATETLDNVISYSVGLKPGGVLLRVRKAPAAVSLIFWFKSRNFQAFASQAEKAGGKKFDPAQDRYRGLGLSMCRALSKAYRFRAGTRIDAIIASF